MENVQNGKLTERKLSSAKDWKRHNNRNGRASPARTTQWVCALTSAVAPNWTLILLMMQK
jgi:hypothetical protein